ncbi:MAG TPA: LysM peptidoglycan-binding domain-containing protein [Ktedonobacterales bacterium]
MGTRSTLAPAPDRSSAVRDYRTLTLPAIQKPVPGSLDGGVAHLDDEHVVDHMRPWSLTHNHITSNTIRDVPHLNERTRATRTLMAAGRYAKPDVWARPEHREPTRQVQPARATVVIPALHPERPTPHVENRWGRLTNQLAVRSRQRSFWVITNLALLLVVGLGIAGQQLLPTDAAAACSWHTVVPNDTLGNLGYENHTTAMAIARANHIRNPNLIYVGQRLCIPTTAWAQSHSAPAVPHAASLALPQANPSTTHGTQVSAPAPVAGLPAGEPCTADRSIVWTVPVSRWAIPPGCFGGVYHPNPANYKAYGHVIPGFGWCNWWPEALLRDPNAIFRPRHSTPRVGVPVYYAPQPGDRTGHYAFVESIGTGKNAGWILISEMNMYWRGAGWAKVNYRYIRVDYPGANYLY